MRDHAATRRATPYGTTSSLGSPPRLLTAKPEDEERGCLICYDEQDVTPLPCCGKGICDRCARLLRRRTFQLSSLCPFCRRPEQGLDVAKTLRQAIFTELQANSPPAFALHRIIVLIMLAPKLVQALEVAVEALTDLAASSSDKTGAAVATLAVQLCRRWPASAPLCFLEAFAQFWRDLALAGPQVACDNHLVVDLFAELAYQRALGTRDLVGQLWLRHGATSPAQRRFAVALLRQLQKALGEERLRLELLPEDEAAEATDNCALESRPSEEAEDGDALIADNALGIFPVDGHPANVRFARGVFEEAGLAWLCEHESFGSLAVLSDSEDEREDGDRNAR
eukprot:TRINITY_DN72172_c0_g1_i1.p2 TRINITY_DN72172_c0_g1~~TRINITY_DN72172_c0_g1_i1.p2  ORF type:complete len:339 (-),score=97.62 TRINITY_DN72172_c0_g1_i1:8-1024(-)